MLISISKLVLYTLCAGIHLNRTLPLVLDVRTDNHKLLNEDLYFSLQRPRVRGEKYDAFINRFIRTCRKRFPKTYIHFEDFGLQKARRILDKYNHEIPCFNEDDQGTGCVALAALYAATHVAKYKMQDLRVVMFGAGSASIGIADRIRDATLSKAGSRKRKLSSRSGVSTSRDCFCRARKRNSRQLNTTTQDRPAGGRMRTKNLGST